MFVIVIGGSSGRHVVFAELSDLIFDTVIQKEHNLQETLGERLSTARRIYRKALLESAVAHKIEIKDHNINITHIKDQVLIQSHLRLLCSWHCHWLMLRDCASNSASRDQDSITV